MSSMSMTVISLSGGATVESAHRNGFKGRSVTNGLIQYRDCCKKVKLVAKG